MKLRRILFYLWLFGAWSAGAQTPSYPWLLLPPGESLADRIATPAGYARIELPPSSFADWLRHLPLKPDSTPVRLYNGRLKPNQSVHAAVVDLDVGSRDLQQCADAVIRLRAEYLYSRAHYGEILFHFTSGDPASFRWWMAGSRPRILGHRVTWSAAAKPDSSHQALREYLQTVFTYAGTRSLQKEMPHRNSTDDMQIGDVFVQGGNPGHAVIVVDMAVNSTTGKKVFLLAQSYMPAQDVHILRNPSNPLLSPWYPLDFGEILVTPEWIFRAGDLHCFPQE